MPTFLIGFLVLIALSGTAVFSHGAEVAISFKPRPPASPDLFVEILAGPTPSDPGTLFRFNDIATYDPVLRQGSVIYQAPLFVPPFELTDVDALHILDNGNFLFSTATTSRINGVLYNDGDIFELNPVTNTVSKIFDEGLFTGPIFDSPDINAVFQRTNGNLILSVDGDLRGTGKQTLGGLTFEPHDLIEYNPTTNQASLFLDAGSLLFNPLGLLTNIDAFHILPNGNYLFSVEFPSTELGGLTFDEGDIVEYSPLTGQASVFFSKSNFLDPPVPNSRGPNIDAVSRAPVHAVPSPSAMLLMGSGLLVGLVGRLWLDRKNARHKTS